jgi:hypothetical protein
MFCGTFHQADIGGCNSGLKRGAMVDFAVFHEDTANRRSSDMLPSITRWQTVRSKVSIIVLVVSLRLVLVCTVQTKHQFSLIHSYLASTAS